ncbi:MAG: hypothetical protein F6K19_16890 [Cyanothece sp. SIO1E1]|nr:hypothetical protein [Cyanothece sp. SIO1E1]
MARLDSSLTHQADADAYNSNSLQRIMRAIAISEGEFALILARCNYEALRESMIQRLRQQCSTEIYELTLPTSIATLYTTIQAELENNQPAALMILGLESVSSLEQVLTSTNQVREEFRKQFPFPLVLWVNDEVLRKLIRLAPDFESWATTIEFVLATCQLVEALRCGEKQLFDRVLGPDSCRFLSNKAIFGYRYRQELEFALVDLADRNQTLSPPMQASLEFVRGRDAYADDKLDQALTHYQRSLEFWLGRKETHGRDREDESNGLSVSLTPTDPTDPASLLSLEHQGVLQYHIGLCYLRRADLERVDNHRQWELARRYFYECIESFERAEHPDLVSKFIDALAEVLLRLQHWDELQAIAQRALSLHHTCAEPFRLSQAYGYLSQVAMAQSAWTEAREWARNALTALGQALLAATDPALSTQETELTRKCSLHQGWYLFCLGRAEYKLGQTQVALKTLEAARAATQPEDDPELYIQILQDLRDSYFQQGQYLTAFQFKQERCAIEQQFGFRAFVGAGQLQPERHVANPASLVGQPDLIPGEITDSGRQHDINCLVNRISRNDHKLTVIYGNSGVGKSSILKAGLIPTLQQKGVGAHKVWVILQQNYSDWLQGLGRQLEAMLVEESGREREIERGTSTTSPGPTQSILTHLRKNVDRNLLTVLIFDQFEEFFFVCREASQKQLFCEFLRECLDIPYVNVILSLREDYLHYLLELNRLTSLAIINNNILDKSILYHLSNFSRNDAQLAIQRLCKKAKFRLEPELIEALGHDLANESAEVRPIELQVVGAQLQAENITTLSAYQNKGPKAKLVERYLEAVVQDCGPENQRTARLVLYLLTDEQGTRPLKTQAELAGELESEADNLDLVLKVLVGAGLIFEVPEALTDRYQLVHDYLVPFIRQSQEPELLAELKLTKQQLKQALHQEQQERRRAKIAEIEALSSLSQALLRSHQLQALVASVKSAQKLLETDVPIDIEQRTIDSLKQVISTVKERNCLEGHDGPVFDVSFSPLDAALPDKIEPIIASASADGTFRLWTLDGALLMTCHRHHDQVLEIHFSPNGQLFASASADKTVKLWRRNGTLLRNLKGHRDRVVCISFQPSQALASELEQVIATASEYGIIKLWRSDGILLKTLMLGTRVFGLCFSPDGELLAAASEYGTIKLWRSDTWLKLRTFRGHDDSVLHLSFSPDGQILASASADGTVKLWNLEGQALKTLQHHNCRVYRVSFSPDGQMLASASADGMIRLYSVEGTELRTFQGHNGPVFSVSFSPDGQLLASASEDKTIRLWSLDGIGPHTCQGHTGRVLGVSFSADSEMFASASEDKTVKLWRLDGTLLKTFQGHQASVRSVDFSPEQKLLVSASVDGILKLWRLDGTLLKTFQGHQASVRHVLFRAAGQLLASASNDRTVKLWQMDGTLLTTLQGHSARVLAVDFSPDGQFLASASARTVALWTCDGTLLRTLQGHHARVFSVSFSPDGEIIASASADKTVKLWHRDGMLLKTLRGHDAGVRCVSFSPDGEILATGSADRTVRLWHQDGSVIKTLKGHLACLCGITFSADGHRIISMSEDGTLKVWNFEGTELQTFQGHIDGDRRRLEASTRNILSTPTMSPATGSVEQLLAMSCNWLQGYLANNPHVEESDRHLCDGIL